MLKKIMAFAVALYATMSFAAVDVNKATAAELDGVKGVGPSISSKILDERKKGNFKDWNDFITRVSGIGEGNAAKFSAEGMTVNGAAFKGAAAAPAAAKAEEKKPAAAAKTEEKKPAADDKMKKADEAKAKEAKPAAKDEKAADAAKPAASAAKK